MSPIGWLMVGIAWVVFGWITVLNPGSTMFGPCEWRERFGRTQVGRFASIAVGITAIILGFVMIVAAAVALIAE